MKARRPEHAWLQPHYDNAYEQIAEHRGHAPTSAAIELLTSAIRNRDLDDYKRIAMADAIEDALNDKEED